MTALYKVISLIAIASICMASTKTLSYVNVADPRVTQKPPKGITGIRATYHAGPNPFALPKSYAAPAPVQRPALRPAAARPTPAPVTIPRATPVAPVAANDRYINGQIYYGDVTYYTEWKIWYGSCGFDWHNMDQFLVAMSFKWMRENPNLPSVQHPLCKPQYCVQIDGPVGSIVAKVTDSCEGCKDYDVDIADSVYKYVANVQNGRNKVNWHFVDCNVKKPGIIYTKAKVEAQDLGRDYSKDSQPTPIDTIEAPVAAALAETPVDNQEVAPVASANVAQEAPAAPAPQEAASVAQEAEAAPAQEAAEATQEVPATEAAQEAPVTEAAQEATEATQDAPVTEAAQEAPATEAAQEAPATEAAQEAPVTEAAPAPANVQNQELFKKDALPVAEEVAAAPTPRLRGSN